MAAPEAGKPSYRSTFPTAVMLTATFLVVGFLVEWASAGFASALEAFWPTRFIAFVAVMPIMMLVLKYFSPRRP